MRRPALLALLLTIAGPAAAQAVAPLVQAPPLSHADLADLTLAAPTIVRATITRTDRIADRDSPGLAPGRARLLVTATVAAALVAPGTIPATLIWLWDAPLDARGRAPRPKGASVLAWLAAPAADGKTQLIAGAGLQSWEPGLEARVRTLATEARSGAVPVITGVTSGFRSQGTVAGESESQFFLAAADGKPLALVVTAKPGETTRVAVARGNVIDESATAVRPDTLLRYRLACFLPATLPTTAGGDDSALAADWRTALTSLGPCGRTL